MTLDMFSSFCLLSEHRSGQKYLFPQVRVKRVSIYRLQDSEWDHFCLQNPSYAKYYEMVPGVGVGEKLQAGPVKDWGEIS